MTFGWRNEWRWLFAKHNCTSFTFWLFWIERDRVCGELKIEFLLLGIGFWTCIAWGDPSEVFMDALKAVSRPVAAQKEKP